MYCIYIDLLIFKFALNICLSPTRAYCFTLPTVEEQNKDIYIPQQANNDKPYHNQNHT